jgi:glycogen debranching enzyme
MCALGLSKYGYREDAIRLVDQLLAAASSFDMRLPELFCGFGRGSVEAPVPYPVACLPQAWAAGAVFMLAQACLGLRIDAWNATVFVNNPALPSGVNHLRITRLSVGTGIVNIEVTRRANKIDVQLTGASGVRLVRT